MDPRVETELHARIAGQSQTLQTWLSADPSTSQMRRRARASAGFAAFDVAVCHLILGQTGAVRPGFAQAAGLMYEAVEGDPDSPIATFTSALESAVLSGDEALAQRIASDRSTHSQDLVGDRLCWAQALPALIARDDARAAACGEAASSVDDAKAWYPGSGEAIAGLAGSDPGLIVEGLSMVLDKHRRYAVAKKSWCYNWGYCLLCVPACVITGLASRRGMSFDLPGHIAEVPFTLMYTQPKESVVVEIDFMPQALIG